MYDELFLLRPLRLRSADSGAGEDDARGFLARAELLVLPETRFEEDLVLGVLEPDAGF